MPQIERFTTKPEEIEPYTCPTCQKMVTFRPCQVCVGRRAQAHEQCDIVVHDTNRHDTAPNVADEDVDIVAITAQIRDEWLQQDITKRYAEATSLTEDRTNRLGAYREEVEARLDLHGRLVRALLSRVGRDDDRAIPLQTATEWIERDRQQILVDLFHPRSDNKKTEYLPPTAKGPNQHDHRTSTQGD